MTNDDLTLVGGEEVLEVGKSFVLPVGTPLQIELGGVLVKMSSVSVGWLPDQYLVIRKPSTGFGSIVSKLFKGNKITVRYISDGDAFAFQSEVVGSSDSPGLIFVAYPSLVVRRNLRRSRRVLCYLPAEFQKETDERGLIPDVVSGILADLSLSGCAFEMIKGPDTGPPDVKVDDAVKLHVQLPGQEQPIEFPGLVRRILRDGKRFSVGIEFRDMDADTEGKTADYIRTIEKFA